MKKIYLLLLLIFLTCGCTVNYDLNITDEGFSENILIKSETFDESENLKNDPWPYKAHYTDLDAGEEPEKLEGVDYYLDETTLNENNFYQKKLSYNFNKKDFNDDFMIKNCYEKFYYDESNKEIALSTSQKVLCMENYNIDNININIKVPYNVTAHNADSIKGNTYTWTINKDNYQNRSIILSYEKNDITENKPDNEKEEEKTPLKSRVGLVSVVISIFIIFIVGVFVYKIKNNM